MSWNCNLGQWIVVILILLSHHAVSHVRGDGSQWEGFIVRFWPIRGRHCDTGPTLTGITWRMKSRNTGQWPPKHFDSRINPTANEKNLSFMSYTEIRYFTKLVAPRSQKFINPTASLLSSIMSPSPTPVSQSLGAGVGARGMWVSDQFQFVSRLRDEWSAEIICDPDITISLSVQQACHWSPSPPHPGPLIGHKKPPIIIRVISSRLLLSTLKCLPKLTRTQSPLSEWKLFDK